MLFLDNRVIPPFPNCYTLMPTLGTALIIIFGNHHTLVGRLLSTRPLRWIGLISYSAYLWHQPLLVFLRLRPVQMHNVSYLCFIVVTVFLLATVTYFLVEKPFRNRTLVSWKHIFCTSWIGAVLILLVALFLIRITNNRTLASSQAVNNRSLVITDNIANRFMNISEEPDTYLQDIDPYELSDYTTRRFHNHMKTYPTFSNQSALTNRRMLLIGDSFAQEFMNMAAETGRLTDYEIRCHYVICQCQIYMGSEDRLQWINPIHRGMCIDEKNFKLPLPLIREANIIILAGLWMEWSAKRLPKTIELLNLTQSQKLIVLGVKNFGNMNLTLYVNQSFAYRVQLFQHPDADFVKVNAFMKQAFDASIFVDVMSMTCTFPNGTCPVFTSNGKLISYDGMHVTKNGARYIGEIIFKNFPLNQL